MDKNNVVIIFVCHNTDIVNSLLSDKKKINCKILFVGNESITDDLLLNPNIIVARDLPINIEKEKDLLTFTAWYAITKNNLFIDYEYICILEYDVILENNFQEELIEKCKMKNYDLISFQYIACAFNFDVNQNIFKYFLSKKNECFKDFDEWFCTTNHCIKRNILYDFVDWYYPDCLEIKKLDPIKFSWYHERLFFSFIDANSYNIYYLNLLKHSSSNSHLNMHNKKELSNDLITNYINNPNCEFLDNFIKNYDFFLKLNLDFKINIGSYLCPGSSYTYDYNIYEKQKLLFESAKTCKNVLLIGNYMGHIGFIMLMANPNIKITCIDIEENQKYIYLLESYFKVNISFYVSNNQNTIEKQIAFLNNDIDFIHISQQYPNREYLNTYIDLCINNTKLNEITFIADDYNVYSHDICEKIKLNNLHCEISNDIITNGSNLTKKWVMTIKYKKYALVYDDGSNNFNCYINILVDSFKKYDPNFEIIIFHKNDIDNDFLFKNKHIFKQHRGGGYWLWKPYIINETLKKLKDNDILFYIDSKYYFTEKFSELLNPLLNQDLLVWRNKPNEPSYLLKNWCKMDIINKYDIYDPVFIQNIEICWAGAIVMKKTNPVVNIIQEWLQMSSSDDITDLSSRIPNSLYFFDHRHDQSLLSIVLFKYNIKLHDFPKKFLQNVRQPY
jgi:hypothetical protein